MLAKKKRIKLINHDNRKRFFIRIFWLRRILIRAFFKCFGVATLFKQSAVLGTELIFFGSGARSLSASRCVLTGRSRAVDLKFRISRFSFRIAASAGTIDGLSLASW